MNELDYPQRGDAPAMTDPTSVCPEPPVEDSAGLEPKGNARTPQSPWVTAIKIVIPIGICLLVLPMALMAFSWGGVGVGICETSQECRSAKLQFYLACVAGILALGGGFSAFFLCRSRRWWIPASIMAVGALPYLVWILNGIL
ncbi:MAG: hypothetical protein LBH68_08075 [Bifidobacteriaceae bacterium]|nr:hypothetical protein [Bifidobacteriaceae bacterium]